ncbi:2-hydroxyacid dehydrogenase [Nocardia arizonensis]|uniref:2-hydroxyacid dehydrogenase n=1 Tax=Nocardia arizonensis TaxID=1141647 RepID=UPI0006D1E94D|nr:2-hydroxyacid dehydrogenase [Nocardia arizonensis]
MQKSPIVLVTGSSIDPKFLKQLESEGCVVRTVAEELRTEDALIRALDNVRIYLLGGNEVATAEVIRSAPDLELIAFLGVGYESFMDVDAVRERGIRVTNTPNISSNSVAEFTIGQLLNCRRRLTEYSIQYSNGLDGDEEKLRDVRGHSVGIIGLGGIGTRIAEILTRGFGAEVCYYSRTRKRDVEDALGITYRELTELFSTVESVIVMTPGNRETAGLIGDDQLCRLSEGSVLVNTARAEVVDPYGLLEHLNSGRLGAAAFDGFYRDDLPVTWELKKMQPSPLSITGGIASLTHDARDGMAERTVRSILNFLRDGTDEFLVE